MIVYSYDEISVAQSMGTKLKKLNFDLSSLSSSIQNFVLLIRISKINLIYIHATPHRKLRNRSFFNMEKLRVIEIHGDLLYYFPFFRWQCL